jgi:hypothetical protein
MRQGLNELRAKLMIERKPVKTARSSSRTRDLTAIQILAAACVIIMLSMLV